MFFKKMRISYFFIVSALGVVVKTTFLQAMERPLMNRESTAQGPFFCRNCNDIIQSLSCIYRSFFIPSKDEYFIHYQAQLGQTLSGTCRCGFCEVIKYYICRSLDANWYAISHDVIQELRETGELFYDKEALDRSINRSRLRLDHYVHGKHRIGRF